jgi:choline dehydrogenase-like flavoprotein
LLIDLRQSDRDERTEHTSVCVIGGGAAGIYLAVSLASKGEDVAVLEAGDIAAADGSTLVGADTRYLAEPYPAATAGRYFGVGGTTTHWGGLLVPHTTHNIRSNQIECDPWSHIVNVASRRGRAVLRTLAPENDRPIATNVTRAGRHCDRRVST